MPDITIPDAAVEAFKAAWHAADDEGRAGERVRAGLTAAAPHIAAQALRDAEKQIECQHVGPCLIVGNDYCNAPEDGAMVRSAMLARASRIEVDHG